MIGKLFRKIRARGNASTPEQKQAEVMREVDEALAFDDRALTTKPLDDRETTIRDHKKRATLDRAAFFEHLRQPIFGGRISQDQVEGCEAIIDAMAGDPIAWVAYALATARHETGGRFKPNTENLNYSVAALQKFVNWGRISRADADRLGRKPGEGALSLERQRDIANIIYGGKWGRVNLGNTEEGDGWLYRGRGLSHVTGRWNYQVSGEALGVDLVKEPGLMLETETAVRELVSGMKEGRYRPPNSLVRLLPTVGLATAAQFGRARDIINGGSDRAADIAGTALHFQTALRKADWR